MVQNELLTLEHAGWGAILEGRGGEYYEAAMTPDSLMVVEGMVIDRDTIASTFDGPAPWDWYEIVEPRIVSMGQDAAALVYLARARRGDDEVTLRMTTTYVRVDGQQRVALHQQTPA
jgi:hypothetical protein